MRVLFCYTLACGLFFAGVAAHGAEVDPAQILNHVDDLYRGNKARGTIAMKVVTEHWTRSLKLAFWSQGTDHTLARILSPKKEKGTATLRVGNDVWNYLPKVKRVIKVPGSMMGSSWMGSHFTNDDLVRQTRMAEDYNFTVTFSGERAGRVIYEVTCIPKEDAAVVWGKIVVEVLQKGYLPIRTRYYDEELALARTMAFGEVRKSGSRVIPMRLKITPEDKAGEYTEVIYQDLRFDVKLKSDMFTLRQLQR